MPRILAFDTSSEACSVCLNIDGTLYSEVEYEPRQHSQRLLPMIQNVLATQSLALHELDAIAFGRGPGSFTGLRIAAGVAQGLSFGADVGVLPISNLRALALSEVTPEMATLVAIDARMKEVYWGIFEADAQGYPKALDEERVCAPELLALPDGHYKGVGSGFAFYDQMSAQVQGQVLSFNKDVIPLAETIARLAAYDFAAGQAAHPALTAQPVYIRDEVAWKKLPGR